MQNISLISLAVDAMQMANKALGYKHILQKAFGHEDFRGEQLSIITAALAGESSLVILPTGMGKSLCFQMPSLLQDDLVLVVSPLVALMQDQADKARALGLDVSFINSSLTTEQRQSRQEALAAGKFKLLYVTPERFKKEDFWQALSGRKIGLFAVDEAHCIAQWGHDFRPEYSRLGEIRKQLGNPVTMALTATATPRAQQEILSALGIPDAKVFLGGIERPNLSLNFHQVHGFDEKIRSLVGLRHHFPGPAIVYFSLIGTLQKASSELARLGFHHLVYHGNLGPGERKRQQRRFFSEDSPIMLATPAFGLGVDKADVRLLVHFELPGSVESYYQEAGRAGRDGNPASCHCFADDDDLTIQMEFIKWANPDANFIRKVYDLIESNPLRVQQEGFDFLREQMNFYNRRDFRVETAVNLLARWGSLREIKTRFGYEAVTEPDKSWLEDLHSEERLQVLHEKLLDFVRLAKQESGCRKQTVYQYFGQVSEPCGICDLCQKAKT